MAIGYTKFNTAQELEQYIRERQATWPSDPQPEDPLRNTGILFVDWTINEIQESIYNPEDGC